MKITPVTVCAIFVLSAFGLGQDAVELTQLYAFSAVIEHLKVAGKATVVHN